MSIMDKLRQKELLPASQPKRVEIKTAMLVEDDKGNQKPQLVETGLWFEILPPTCGIAFTANNVAMALKLTLAEEIKTAREEKDADKLEELQNQLFGVDAELLSKLVVGWNEDYMEEPFTTSRMMEMLSDPDSQFIHQQLQIALADVGSFVHTVKKS